MDAPDPDGAGDVGGGDPLAVGGEAGDGGVVGVLAVDGGLERSIQVADDDGSAVTVEDRVGFRIARYQNPSAPFCGGNARVGL